MFWYECKLESQPEFQQTAIRKGAKVKEHCNTDLEGKERAQVGGLRGSVHNEGKERAQVGV